MKNFCLLLSAGLFSVLVGCSSTPVALAPVGPNPAGLERPASDGQLQVFTSLIGRSEGNNPAWSQHTGYYIFDLNGRLIKHVHNTIGRYAEAPSRVMLPAGKYLVKAQANDYFWVSVPVTIERGRTTRIHLDDNWKLPADASKSELVSLPNGNPVGWRAESTKASGINGQ